MSQFASKDDLIAAQAARIAELEAEVDAERHHHGIRNASAVRTLHALGYSWRGNDAWQPPAEQGKCLHQIAEPAAPVGKPIEDAIDALVMAAFTEGGCSEHRMSEARIQTELRKKELRTLLSTPQPCSRSHPHEEMTPMCELRTEIARLTNALARTEAAALPWPRAEVDDLLERLVSSHISSFIAGERGSNKPEAREFVKSALVEAAGFIRAVLHPLHPAEGVPAPMPVPHPHHCTARTADGSCEECEGHAQAMAEWNAERSNLAATHPTQQGLDDRDVFERAYAEHAIAYAGLDAHVDDVAQRVKDGRDGNSYKHLHDSGAWVGWNLALAAQAKQGGV